MAAQVLSNVQVLFGSTDMSPFTGEIDLTGETEMKEANHFAAGGYQVVLPGISRFGFALKGNADFASGAVNATFGPAQQGSQYAAAVVYNGSAGVVGDPVVFTRGRLESMKFASGNVGDVASFDMSMMSDTAEVAGYIAAPLASRSGAATGTAVALAGPTASQRLWAALFVTAAAGTNLAVKIQSDNASNFPSATDRITFSTVSAVGWQFAYVDGDFSSETHHRMTATIGSSTFSYAVVMGVM